MSNQNSVAGIASCVKKTINSPVPFEAPKFLVVPWLNSSGFISYNFISGYFFIISIDLSLEPESTTITSYSRVVFWEKILSNKLSKQASPFFTGITIVASIPNHLQIYLIYIITNF